MKGQDIQNLVNSGVPIEYFEGDEKDMANLKRFVSTRQDFERRVNPPTKTTLIIKGDVKPVVKPTAQEDKLKLAKGLVDKGIGFDIAHSAVSSSPDDIKKVEGIADVISALGLDGRAGGKKIYDAIRDAK